VSVEQEMQSALQSFVVEGREFITQMESDLLGLEEGDSDGAVREMVNSLFRAAHTIKGSSGLFGLDHIVRFTHVVESVLDRLRDDEITVSSELINALLPCVDHLSRLLSDVAEGRLDEDPGQGEVGTALVDGLQPFLQSTPVDASDDAGESPGDPGDGTRRLQLSLRFGADCLRNGMDPLAFIRYLSTLGEIVGVTTLPDLIPDAEAFDPETCYLAFAVTFQTDASVDAVADVFEFVRDSSTITILSPQDPASEYAAMVRDAGVLGPRLREVLVRAGAVDVAALDAALEGRPGPVVSGPVVSGPVVSGPVGSVPSPRTGDDVLAGRRGDGLSDGERESPTSRTSAGATTPAGGQTQGTRQAQEARQGAAAERRAGERRVGDRRGNVGGGTGGAASRESSSIRIDATRLDRLIDAVGELVIAGASAELGASQNRDEALLSALGEVMRLVEEVRDSALQLRMVPIGTTFSRFQRVVRDVSAALGKDVGLVISGGDTEVDKALVEHIADPLMHLVRNSMDHGIEPAEVRAASGKPARGTLRLNAFHDSGSIVIEVSDDGGGIDTERVFAKAVERGLVEPGVALSDGEISQLIFEPGFSTAESVSDLSGRGVGMDVVRRNVTALRGTIDVDNRPGEGCTIRVRLPLTLAIIDGFMVIVGGATFVIPLDSVVECVELPAGSDRRDCMGLRGEVLPFIRLRQLFQIKGERPRRENVVVVEYAGTKIGLVVDTLMGEFQTVIKPLGRLFEHVQAIGGSTILGNGEVALIIDVPLLVRQHTDRSSAGNLVG
jgi:two-component system chemotaxis sensor kinase CheA